MPQDEDTVISGATPAEGEQPDGAELSDQDAAEEEGQKPDEVADKRVRDAQQALHEKTTELSQTKERMAKIEGMLEAMKGREVQQTENENPFAFLDAEDLADKLNEDPGSQTAALIRKVVGEVHKTLVMRDRWLTEQLQERDRRLESLAPDRVQLREAIAELKKDPDYASLDDSVLAVIAKKQKSKPAGRQVAEFPGSPGGSGRVRAVGGGGAAVNKAVEAGLAKLYPDMFGEEGGK